MSRINKRIGTAWLIATGVILLTTAGAFDPASTAEAASTVFTQGRDLGILAGVIVAFMLVVWLFAATESRRRQKVAELNARALEAVSSALQQQSISVATSIHNMIEHNQQLSHAADRRIDEFIAFGRGRPCFMAEDARDLLREASKANRSEPHEP